MKSPCPPKGSLLAGIILAFSITPILHAAEPAGTDSLGTQFVRLPAGEFRMGASKHDGTNVIETTHPYDTIPDGVGSTYEMRFKESPAHQVRLTEPFEIATHEVTVDQWKRFLEATGYHSTVEAAGGILTPVPDDRPGVLMIDTLPEADWQSPGFEQAGNHPVVGISWEDANAFCQWMTQVEGRQYRLPTEAEWEYACRAGTDTIYSTGNDPQDVVKTGNMADASFAELYSDATARQRVIEVAKRHDDGYVYTAPIGSYPPNPWGLHDMHGNVWEWTNDIYLEKEYQRRMREEAKEEVVTDPTGPKEAPAQEFGNWRVVRGGSWMLGPIGARCSMRGYWQGDSGSAYIGFRVVREAE